MMSSRKVLFVLLLSLAAPAARAEGPDAKKVCEAARAVAVANYEMYRAELRATYAPAAAALSSFVAQITPNERTLIAANHGLLASDSLNRKADAIARNFNHATCSTGRPQYNGRYFYANTRIESWCVDAQGNKIDGDPMVYAQRFAYEDLKVTIRIDSRDMQAKGWDYPYLRSFTVEELLAQKDILESMIEDSMRLPKKADFVQDATAGICEQGKQSALGAKPSVSEDTSKIADSESPGSESSGAAFGKKRI